MHAVRLGFVNWGVRKVSGVNREMLSHSPRAKPWQWQKTFTAVSRMTLMDPRAGPLPGV